MRDNAMRENIRAARKSAESLKGNQVLSSGHGGKRSGAGRKPGVPNKIAAEIKTLAQKHGEDIIQELARLALKSKSEQVRVAAAKELLDRGYGKATQFMASDPENPLVVLMREFDGRSRIQPVR